MSDEATTQLMRELEAHAADLRKRANYHRSISSELNDQANTLSMVLDRHRERQRQGEAEEGEG
jgi:hypothetical protein